MKESWQALWRMARLQGEPEQFTAAPFLLLLVAVLSASLSIGLQLAADKVSTSTAIGMTGVGLLVDALALWGLVLLKTVKARWISILAAMLGVDFLLGLIAIPAVAMALYMDKTPWLAVSVFFQMALVGWNLAARGYILHRNLRIGIIQANVLAFTLFLLTVFLATKLYPELMPPIS